MVVGTLRKEPEFGFIYRIIKRSGWPKPDISLDNPEPHTFAQGFGGAVMIIGLLFLFTGFSWVGWGFIWIVISLAALNIFGGFCVGCAFYYWMNHLKVPGFTKSPPQGINPGVLSDLKPCDGC